MKKLNIIISLPLLAVSTLLAVKIPSGQTLQKHVDYVLDSNSIWSQEAVESNGVWLSNMKHAIYSNVDLPPISFKKTITTTYNFSHPPFANNYLRRQLMLPYLLIGDMWFTGIVETKVLPSVSNIEESLRQNKWVDKQTIIDTKALLMNIMGGFDSFALLKETSTSSVQHRSASSTSLSKPQAEKHEIISQEQLDSAYNSYMAENPYPLSVQQSIITLLSLENSITFMRPSLCVRLLDAVAETCKMFSQNTCAFKYVLSWFGLINGALDPNNEYQVFTIENKTIISDHREYGYNFNDVEKDIIAQLIYPCLNFLAYYRYLSSHNTTDTFVQHVPFAQRWNLSYYLQNDTAVFEQVPSNLGALLHAKKRYEGTSFEEAFQAFDTYKASLIKKITDQYIKAKLIATSLEHELAQF